MTAMRRDINWLGFEWVEEHNASDYFEALYDYAVKLIEGGKAYVCSLSADEIRSYRGTLTEPGTDSPYRDRSVEENLDLFRRMRAGEFEDGAHVLRLKIDMASGNMNCVILVSIVSGTWHITKPGTRGVCIPFMTTPTVFLMP